MFTPNEMHLEAELPRKRLRPVVSCIECHRRKQKCDRQQPCFHCTKRGLGNSCVYETGHERPIVSSLTHERAVLDDGGVSVSNAIGPASLPDLGTAASLLPRNSDSHLTACLGYANDNTGTRAIIDIIGPRDLYVTSHSDLTVNAASEYKALVRQLPPRSCIEKLVCFYYAEISWQYDIVDEDTFRQHALLWDRVPYASRGNPHELDPAVRCFPALLFQTLAQAVLFQPQNHDSFLADLKEAPDMNLVDLAAEYSDTGHRILSILGSTEPTLAKVHASLQRAIFLKATGSVVDAWHILGNAIRDAQELGLHRHPPSSGRKAQTSSDGARGMSADQKTWLVLHLWDAHMAVVLGRPMITKLDSGTVPFPCHGIPDSDGDDSGLRQQITPFDMILCGYHAAYKHLQDVHHLDTTKPDALEIVDRIHAAILAGIDHMPAWARFTDPLHDNRCLWLPAARETLDTEINFTLLALHRPFIFSHVQNRTEALKAALRILQSQNRLFNASKPRNILTFNLIFATFDATVITAAIYILFPQENLENLQSSLLCVQWALERLHAMKAQNKLAASACVAVHAIHEKFLDSVMRACASPTMSRDLRQQDVCHAPENLHPAHMELAGPQWDSTPAIPQGLEQGLLPLPFHDLDVQDWTSHLPSMTIRNAVANDTGEAHSAYINMWEIPNSEHISPPLLLHDLIFQDSTDDMLPVQPHDMMA